MGINLAAGGRDTRSTDLRERSKRDDRGRERMRERGTQESCPNTSKVGNDNKSADPKWEALKPHERVGTRRVGDRPEDGRVRVRLR